MSYKHIRTGDVISEADYWKLKHFDRNNYRKCQETVTHNVVMDESGDFITSMIIGEVMSEALNDSFDEPSNTLSFPDNNDNDSFGGFGGGDAGGGGASGDWSSDDSGSSPSSFDSSDD